MHLTKVVQSDYKKIDQCVAFGKESRTEETSLDHIFRLYLASSDPMATAADVNLDKQEGGASTC